MTTIITILYIEPEHSFVHLAMVSIDQVINIKLIAIILILHTDPLDSCVCAQVYDTMPMTMMRGSYQLSTCVTLIQMFE